MLYGHKTWHLSLSVTPRPHSWQKIVSLAVDALRSTPRRSLSNYDGSKHVMASPASEAHLVFLVAESRYIRPFPTSKSTLRGNREGSILGYHRVFHAPQTLPLPLKQPYLASPPAGRNGWGKAMILNGKREGGASVACSDEWTLQRTG